MSEYSWTPAPWIVRLPADLVSDGRRVTTNQFDSELIADVPLVTDAELIALAPELAEAIIAWDNDQWLPGDEDRGFRPKAIRGIHDLAVKLRAIGGNNE